MDYDKVDPKKEEIVFPIFNSLNLIPVMISILQRIFYL